MPVAVEDPEVPPVSLPVALAGVVEDGRVAAALTVFVRRAVARGLEQLPRVDPDPDTAQLALPGLAQLAAVFGDEGDLLECEQFVGGR